MGVVPNRWTTKIGSVEFPWVTVAQGPFRDENIESHYHASECVCPPEISASLQELTSAAVQETSGVLWNDDGFSLLRFQVKPSSAHQGSARLVLHFGPTTYYHMLTTDQRLD